MIAAVAPAHACRLIDHGPTVIVGTAHVAQRQPMAALRAADGAGAGAPARRRRRTHARGRPRPPTPRWAQRKGPG
jgi:hypothetical protein